jgi:hypothetical protein
MNYKNSIIILGDSRPVRDAVAESEVHFQAVTLKKVSRDSAVSIASTYGLNDRGGGVRVPVG